LSYSSINLATKPIVLSISGHDPSGGAGIQADIEVLNHFDCHPCSIITCLTVQDSSTVHRLIPQEAEAIVEQASILFNDMPINAIKIGLTGSLGAVNAIASIIKSQPNIPIVFDPVLACGDGTPLANADLIGEIKSKLLPLTTVLTPNTIEAAQLSGLQENNDPDQLGTSLLKQGPDYVLLTGGHALGTVLRNHLFNNNEKLASYEWQRQAGHFHGTGCTLASAIAALMATGQSIPDAIELAQTYVDNTIRQAIQLGKGQRFLHRSQA
jgi:hydroxymethylpyrimidine/phosphomethylpyrimidine kinase